MILSFFSPSEYVTGIDYSYSPAVPGIPGIPEIPPKDVVLDDDGNILEDAIEGVPGIPDIPEIPARGNPDCIAVFDIDFDPNTQIASLNEKNEIVIIGKEIKLESIQEKLDRIYSLLISSEDYESVDTEGVQGFNVDQMILSRFFHGDRGSEIGYTQKLIFNPNDPELLDLYKEKEKFKSFITSLNS